MQPLSPSPTAQRQPLVAVLCLCILLMACQASPPSTDAIAPQFLAAQLSAAQAPLILDVRSQSEYAAGHIPGALNIPFREIPSRISELAGVKGSEIVVYCEVGVRASIAELTLRQAGFKVRHLAGHMQRWRQRGLPLEQDVPAPAP